MDVKYYFVRDQVIGGVVSILKVPTEDNLADMRTKVMTAAKFKHYLGLLHVEVG